MKAATNSGRIILFLKSFQAGRVKTRLAARLGERGALTVYAAMVGDLLVKLQPLRDILVPYFDVPPNPSDHPPVVTSLISRGLLKIQRGRDLGERMSSAFQEVFAAGVERAVLIGSDIPKIDSELLGGYLAELRTSPMAIGPAVDGGYYLIGFQRRHFEPSLFHGIEWSTEGVLEQTLDKARSLELGCYIGKELQDVDTVEDLESLAASGSSTGSLAEVLERYLVHAET
jgi:rSAM/selenodomain-associated transferase 1